MLMLRVTGLRTFLGCRRKFYFSEVLKLRPIETPETWWIGTAVHAALAEHYRGNDWTGTIESVREPSVSDDAVKLANGMVENYLATAPDFTNPVLVERDIRMKIPRSSFWVTGRPDLVASMDGSLWVIDHKTVSSYPSPAALETDIQMMLYVWLVRKKMGLPVRGAIHNMLLRRLPKPPRVLASGELSKDVNQSCTAEDYLAEVKRRGLPVNDYISVINGLRDKPFFKRERILVTESALAEWETLLAKAAREACSRTTWWYPNYTKNCPGCEYYRLCIVWRDGGDYRSLVDTFYKVTEGGER